MTEESSKFQSFLRLRQAAEGLKQAFVNAAEGFARFGSALAGMYPRGHRHWGYSETRDQLRNTEVDVPRLVAEGLISLSGETICSSTTAPAMHQSADPRFDGLPPEIKKLFDEEPIPEMCIPPVPMKRLLELS